MKFITIGIKDSDISEVVMSESAQEYVAKREELVKKISKEAEKELVGILQEALYGGRAPI